VLVDRAMMPRLQDLPESLRPLARRHAIELSDTRWEYDVGLLVQHVNRLVDPPAADVKPAVRPASLGPNVETTPSVPVGIELREIDSGHPGAAAAKTGPEDAAARRDETQRASRVELDEQRPAEVNGRSEPRQATAELQSDVPTETQGRPGASFDEPKRHWSIVVAVLTVVALVTAAVTMQPDYWGTWWSGLAGVFTYVSLLTIVLVRRDAPRNYRFWVAAGFLFLVLSRMVTNLANLYAQYFGYAPPALVVNTIPVIAYGCWIIAFTRRGTIRFSWSIIAYLAGAIAIVAAALTRGVSASYALTTIEIAATAWMSFELSRQSQDRGLRWAAWGTGLRLAQRGIFEVLVPMGVVAAGGLFSFLLDFSGWLVAMSVRNEIEPASTERGNS